MIPTPVFMLIDAILQLYQFAVFVMVVMSWLLSFNVVNRHNKFVDAVWRTLIAITEPLLEPIRRIMPNLGGIDLSPVILLLSVYFAREMNRWLMVRIGMA